MFGLRKYSLFLLIVTKMSRFHFNFWFERNVHEMMKTIFCCLHKSSTVSLAKVNKYIIHI